MPIKTCPDCNGAACGDDSDTTDYGLGYMECETCRGLGFIFVTKEAEDEVK